MTMMAILAKRDYWTGRKTMRIAQDAGWGRILFVFPSFCLNLRSSSLPPIFRLSFKLRICIVKGKREREGETEPSAKIINFQRVERGEGGGGSWRLTPHPALLVLLLGDKDNWWSLDIRMMWSNQLSKYYQQIIKNYSAFLSRDLGEFMRRYFLTLKCFHLWRLRWSTQ